VADAAGRQHGALIAPKRTADGQPPSADEGRPKKSRRLTAQLNPSIPEGNTPATLLPVRNMSSDGGSPHLDPSMRGKRPRITPAKFVNTTFVPITGTQAAPSHVATAARTVCRSRRRQSRRHLTVQGGHFNLLCSIRSSLTWRHMLQPVQTMSTCDRRSNIPPLQVAMSTQQEDLRWEDSHEIELVAGGSYILHQAGGSVRAQVST